MEHKSKLRGEERDLLGQLAETVFANPFGGSDERLRRLAGTGAVDPTPRLARAERYEELLPALEAVLRGLSARGIERIDAVAGEGDAHLLRCAYLFRSYEAHFRDFDALIEAQLQAPSHPVAAPFAPKVLAELARYGFDQAEADRLFSLYYQLRRGYYFIEKALVGGSESMWALRQALWNSVFTTDVRTYALVLWDRMEDFSTLLLGGTGTGKGSAAAAIGHSGLIAFERGKNRFAVSFADTLISTNLSQFPESLIESELFGHRKGAFTGAVSDHEGLFGRCRAHGALFLDEIGDVSLPIQTKLLGVLQERRFTPVGSHEEQRFCGRVIAATNRSLSSLMRDGRFRSDFYYRLSSNVIHVPSLRRRIDERPAELRELAEVLLARMFGKGASLLADRVFDALGRLPADYPWPGNVRELEQAIRRIVLNGAYHPDPLPGGRSADPWQDDLAAGRLDAATLLGGYCLRLYRRLGSYEAVAKRMGLDRRTVKRHVDGELERRGDAASAD